MTSCSGVIVKRLPERVGQHQAREFLRELEPSLKKDRPCLVFDFSDVSHLDSAGIEMLLQCMEEAMKRNGDLKLASIPPAIASLLKLTRVDCLFEIFDNSSDAVASFYRFPVYALQQNNEAPHPTVGAGNAVPGTSRRPEE
jgi:anti-sigma B factor antagonist